MLILNPIIVGKVLLELKTRMDVRASSIVAKYFKKIALLGILFETSMILRIVIILYQD